MPQADDLAWTDREASNGSGCLSVVMPCYNEVETVKLVAERVLASPYTNELIIVDDGSTDGTVECAYGIADPRVRVFVQPMRLFCVAERPFSATSP